MGLDQDFLRQKYLYLSVSLQVLFVLLLASCGDRETGNQATGLTVSEDYAVPLNCTIPGKLELGSESENLLKKYMQVDENTVDIVAPAKK